MVEDEERCPLEVWGGGRFRARSGWNTDCTAPRPRRYVHPRYIRGEPGSSLHPPIVVEL